MNSGNGSGLCSSSETKPIDASPSDAHHLLTPQPVQNQLQTDGKTVLITDPDRDLVNILSVRCRRMGLKVLAAYDASVASAIIRRRSPDVICLDERMRTSDGQNLFETIASDASLREVPIIALVGQSDEESVIRCSAMSAYYVEKSPETWCRLEPLLKELLNMTAAPAVLEIEPESKTSTCQVDSVVPPSVAASEPRSDADPIPCDPTEIPDADPLSDTALTCFPLEVTAAIELMAESSTGLAQDDCQSELEPAPAPTKNESEALSERAGLWRQIANAVGRAVSQPVAPNEDHSFSPPSEEPVSGDIDPACKRTDELAFPSTLAAPGSTDAINQDAVRQDEPQLPVFTVEGESNPYQPAPEEEVRLAELDKAWAKIGMGKTSPPIPMQLRNDTSTSEKPKEGGEKIVLIADDDIDLVQMLSLRFEQMGLRVFRSPDAMHALLGAHRARPDLIVLDVNMPGGNGLSVCEMLAGDQALKKIPVIVVTGETNENTQRRCREMHAEYVAKGSGLWDRLEPVVRRTLGLKGIPRAKDVSSGVSSETDAGPRRPQILCVDDDPEISKIIKLRLERYGVDVLRAFNGMQGYWTALDMRPDLIILDMVMPDGSGNYIFGRLRSHPLTEKVPIIMLTGINTPGVRRQMFGMGVDAYLTKPLDFLALLELVRQYMPLIDPNPAKERRAKAELEGAPAR